MTPSGLLDFVYAWVNKIINTEGVRTLPIIEENQSKPRPNPPYITLSDPFGFRSIGRASSGDIKTDIHGVPITNPAGNASADIVQDFAATVTLKEIGSRVEATGVPNGGDGRFLQELLLSIERSEIRQFFKSYGVACMNMGEVTPNPEERGGYWDLIQILDIRLGFAAKTSEVSSWIESVDYTSDFQ